MAKAHFSDRVCGHAAGIYKLDRDDGVFSSKSISYTSGTPRAADLNVPARPRPSRRPLASCVRVRWHGKARRGPPQSFEKLAFWRNGVVVGVGLRNEGRRCSRKRRSSSLRGEKSIEEQHARKTPGRNLKQSGEQPGCFGMSWHAGSFFTRTAVPNQMWPRRRQKFEHPWQRHVRIDVFICI